MTRTKDDDAALELITTEIRQWILGELTTSAFTTDGTFTRITSRDGDGGQIIVRARYFVGDRDRAFELPLWPGKAVEVSVEEPAPVVGIGIMDQPPDAAA